MFTFLTSTIFKLLLFITVHLNDLKLTQTGKNTLNILNTTLPLKVWLNLNR